MADILIERKPFGDDDNGARMHLIDRAAILETQQRHDDAQDLALLFRESAELHRQSAKGFRRMGYALAAFSALLLLLTALKIYLAVTHHN